MGSVIDYLQGVRLELSKVVWPSRSEVIKLTLITLIISGIVGIYLGGLDYLLTTLLSILITK